ncbi:MAG: SPOR domain-containing protein [Pseudomonadota bacterium]
MKPCRFLRARRCVVALAGSLFGGLLLVVASAPQTAHADFAAGAAAYEAGDFDTALAEWQPLAESGMPGAQLALGILYENGRGVLKDDALAATWYQKAAEAGHPVAQFNLGNLYQQGRGVERDVSQALFWWSEAAAQGLPNAQLNMGIAYHLGEGVEPDPERAFRLFLSAANAGNASAQFSAGYAYEKGLGTSVNVSEARRLYGLAAAAGVDLAAERLAGLPLPQTTVTATDTAPIAPLPRARPSDEVTVALADEPPAPLEAEETVVASVTGATADDGDEPLVPVAATAGDWPFIQLAAYQDAGRAESAWQDLGQRFPDLLGDLPYRVQPLETGSEPALIYGLQAGPLPDRDEAEAICAVLRTRDADCFLFGP